ncbi:hypothetical protein GN958_ATG10552, partial [Phytophthora infestans]
ISDRSITSLDGRSDEIDMTEQHSQVNENFMLKRCYNGLKRTNAMGVKYQHFDIFNTWYTCIPRSRLHSIPSKYMNFALACSKSGFRYLEETMKWDYKRHHVQAYSDEDFAKQKRTVALHTTEAEYMALSMMVQEVVHLRQLLEKLKMKQQEGSKVFVDNESTKKLAKIPQLQSRTKHITSMTKTQALLQAIAAAPEGGTSASINGEDEDGALEDYGQPNPAGVSLLRRGFGGRPFMDAFAGPAHTILTISVSDHIREPQSAAEAMRSDHWVEWRAAMDKELVELDANATWELVDAPNGANIVTSKWLRQGDVPNAYLKSALDKSIYLKPPIGTTSLNDGRVWLLLKGLNGLKQSGNGAVRILGLNVGDIFVVSEVALVSRILVRPENAKESRSSLRMASFFINTRRSRTYERNLGWLTANHWHIILDIQLHTPGYHYVLSRFVYFSRATHWNGVKRILCYFKCTSSHGLLYKFGYGVISKLLPVIYPDANWAGDTSTAKSTSGAVLQINR